MTILTTIGTILMIIIALIVGIIGHSIRGAFRGAIVCLPIFLVMYICGVTATATYITVAKWTIIPYMICTVIAAFIKSFDDVMKERRKRDLF